MIEVHGDIFEMFESGEYDAICITTNGIIGSNGLAVMGAGVALEAKKRFNGIDTKLATCLEHIGNHVHVLGRVKSGGRIISFPTKIHWRDNSNIKLIKRSAEELMRIVNDREYNKVLITRVGCGNGGLSWSYVKEQISKIIDDRIIIVDNT